MSIATGVDVAGVIIVDDSPVYAHGLRSILAGAGFRVLGNWTAKIDRLPWQRNGRFAKVTDVRALSDLPVTEDDAGVLLLGCSEDPDLLVLNMTMGATRYVDRRASVETLLAVVTIVADGDDDGKVAADHATVLSRREGQVLHQIARGLTHGQIARRLGISQHTVDTYVKRIRSKLDLGNKADLARAAMTGSYGTRSRA